MIWVGLEIITQGDNGISSLSILLRQKSCCLLLCSLPTFHKSHWFTRWWLLLQLVVSLGHTQLTCSLLIPRIFGHMNKSLLLNNQWWFCCLSFTLKCGWLMITGLSPRSCLTVHDQISGASPQISAVHQPPWKINIWWNSVYYINHVVLSSMVGVLEFTWNMKSWVWNYAHLLCHDWVSIFKI